MNIPKIPFYFIRHGQTDWNRNRILMGSQDIPLNETGIFQAEEASLLLEDVKFKSIISSPLSRAYETAKILNKFHKKEIHVIDDLRELSLGKLEGKSKNIVDNWDHIYEATNAESEEEFTKRVYNALSHTLNLEAPTLIVSHGGVYKTICKILEIPVISLNNCQIIYHSPVSSNQTKWLAYDF